MVYSFSSLKQSKGYRTNKIASVCLNYNAWKANREKRKVLFFPPFNTLKASLHTGCERAFVKLVQPPALLVIRWVMSILTSSSSWGCIWPGRPWGSAYLGSCQTGGGSPSGNAGTHMTKMLMNILWRSWQTHVSLHQLLLQFPSLLIIKQPVHHFWRLSGQMSSKLHSDSEFWCDTFRKILKS